MSSLWFILALTITLSHSYSFKTLYQWSQIEYEFESEDQRTAAIANGTFGIGGVQPIDAQYTYAENNTDQARYFVTTPRLTPTGVPFTLSVITKNQTNGNPVIRPYPHWSWQLNPENCNEERIVSVFRVWADECGRLWVIDNGIVGGSYACNPQILAFDLATDKLIYKHEIPQSIYNDTASYITPIAEVLDYADSCLDTYLYVADPATPSLLVYSLKLNQSWAVKDASFEASEEWSNFTVAGDSFTVADGILTVALSPRGDGDKRKLAYHAMANINESYVYTSELRNLSILENGGGDIFHTYNKSRTQQSSLEAYDAQGRLHFALLSDIEIARWNGRREYAPENFVNVGQNNDTMQFPTSLKIGRYEFIQGLWVFATRFQKWAAGTLSTNETNFRILFAYNF